MTDLGASYLGGGQTRFRVWAPLAQQMAVKILTEPEQRVPMQRGEGGYFEAVVEGAPPGTLYRYQLDQDKERPDPASRSQPQGVHGPSEVVDPYFEWSDDWRGRPLEDYVIYELHVGTFTPEGTFDAVIPRLADLKYLGVTAIEIMPVAQFPGARNWGYDGVYPFAVQDSYGGPAGLKRLVNACHQAGLAVILDVVYNHLGPDGNYLWDYGPYFTDTYKTPWGSAVNFDGPYSDEVRHFFIQNALMFLDEFHVDALRLDAVHAMVDFSTTPFLAELAATVEAQRPRLNRLVHLIAESDLNNPRLLREPEHGGYGLDAQWLDDFHHSLHTLLTGEDRGYYQDFGRLDNLAKTLREAYVYSGEYSPFRKRRHGAPGGDLKPSRFVVYAQNHDQIGNRAQGERLSHLVPFPALKVAAGVVLLSPYIPLLFMGEEYGETAPFLYFVSHDDPALVEGIRKGRAEEFAAFVGEGEVPDPQAEETFHRSKLQPQLRSEARHRALLEFYRALIMLRQELPALIRGRREDQQVVACEAERVLFVHRWSDEQEVALVFSFNPAEVTVGLPFPEGRWVKRLDAAEPAWCGDGSLTPDRLESSGAVEVSLAPYACVLWTRHL